jgi:hypothetical protein
MKRESGITSETIREQMVRAANDVYGAERAAELESQIAHLSQMLEGVARQDLALPEYPLSRPTRDVRSGR